jgi:hypothetical protein
VVDPTVDYASYIGILTAYNKTWQQLAEAQEQQMTAVAAEGVGRHADASGFTCCNLFLQEALTTPAC